MVEPDLSNLPVCKMEAIVLCHKLEFPKHYVAEDFSESQHLDLSRTYQSGSYGMFKSEKTTVAYLCYICNKIYTKIKAIRSHNRTHTDAPFSCAECGKTFLSVEYFQHHKHPSHAAAFTCQHCDDKFPDTKINKYIRHKDLEHSIKCPYCEKSFVTAMKFALHRNSVHPESNWYACDWCEKRFESHRMLQLHTAEHERKFAEQKMAKYRCSFCRMICRGKSNLAAHYRQHMVSKFAVVQVKEEQMDELEEEAQKKSNSVTKEEMSSTVDLKKTFGSLSLGAANSRMYVCYVCDRYFTHRYELRRHRVFHADGSTVCLACEIDFATPKALKKHKKLIHLYKCKRCPLVFVKRSQRKEHKRCHEIKEET